MTALSIIGMPVSGIIGALLVYFASKRRDTIETQRVQVEATEVKVTANESDRRRIVSLESRVDSLEADRENDRDYIGVLKGHIWEKKPPPPPDRPTRTLPNH